MQGGAGVLTTYWKVPQFGKITTFAPEAIQAEIAKLPSPTQVADCKAAAAALGPAAKN